MKKILSLIILILLFSLASCGIDKDDLTPNGQQALICVDKLVSMVKTPDTFLLCDDVLVIKYERSEVHTAVFIDYSIENSYGTPLRDIAAFCDNVYLGSVNDLGENPSIEEDFKDMVDYRKALEKSYIELNTAMEYNAYKLYEEISLDGAPQDDFHEKVNKADIAAILNLKINE